MDIIIGETDLDNIASKRDRLQEMNINQLKLEIHDACEKDEKITTNFDPDNKEDVINKAYLDKKLSKVEARLLFSKKD